jgi:mono/diheme cytochrome c family protein
VLLALGGPAGAGERAPERARGQSARPPAARADAGRAVFARMGCGGCHRLAAGGGSGQIGPDLDALLPGHGPASLRAKIVAPYATGGPTYFVAMPRDYGARMSDDELDALVAFLLSTARR